MKIDPHKPLPSHTKLRYEECYAKEFLEFFYPNTYKDLAIRDKPDLLDFINRRLVRLSDDLPTPFDE